MGTLITDSISPGNLAADKYTFEIKPKELTPETLVIISIPAGKVVGAISKLTNTAGNLTFTYRYDAVPRPEITLTHKLNLSNDNSVIVTAEFSEAVEGLAPINITITNGSLVNDSISPGDLASDKYTFEVALSELAVGTPVTISIPAGEVASAESKYTNAAGNLTFRFRYDAVPRPTITLTHKLNLSKRQLCYCHS